MARHESDREDLLREATALTVRAEFYLRGESEPMVAGFRTNGVASFFFRPDWVWHFSPQHQVRRGFVGTELLKAERGELIALRRDRHDQRVELIRREVTPAETEAWLGQLQRYLELIHTTIAAPHSCNTPPAAGDDASCGQAGTCLVAAVPDWGSFVVRFNAWFDQLPRPLQVAPHL